MLNAGIGRSGKQANKIFINNNGVFKSRKIHPSLEERFGRGDGALIADFNQDGLVDLFVVNGLGTLPFNYGPFQLYINETRNENRWVRFVVNGSGKGYTNRDAVGAKAEILTNTGQSQWRYVLGGSGESCQSDRALHFGLGNATSIDVTVFWPPGSHFPNGHQQHFQLNQSQLNKTYRIDELTGVHPF